VYKRQVLWQVEVLGRTPGEAAALLGIDAASLNDLLLQARKTLREVYRQAVRRGILG